MKICIISNGFPPKVDGVGDYVYNLACKFHDAGHNVAVICSAVGTDAEASFEVHRIVDQWDADGIKKVCTKAIDINPDVVCLQYVAQSFHKNGLPFSVIDLMKMLKSEKYTVLTFFHELFVIYEWRIKRVLWATAMRYITWRIACLTDIFATSIASYREGINSLPFLGDKDVAIIPIPSNIPDKILSTNERIALRSKVAPNGELIVAFFGARDIRTSLDAIRLLNGQGKKYVALLIGRVQNVADENFIYKTGLLNIEEIDGYFQVCDILLMPENAERNRGCSFKSTALAQGLKHNLPVVTTKGRLTDESLLDGVNIIFADFGNAICVAEAVERIVLDPVLRSTLSKNIRSITEKLTYEHVCNEYCRVINKHTALQYKSEKLE